MHDVLKVIVNEYRTQYDKNKIGGSPGIKEKLASSVKIFLTLCGRR